jgi:fructan beta-fructosidase
MLRRTICLVFLIGALFIASAQSTYQEPFRPQIHFSPSRGWMNDPNGLIYFDGDYHMFFQYFPDSTVWGPMHWGHAVSKDLLHWKQESIALYPDKLGYIFSGSAVVDKSNTSGLGGNGKTALVAVYTIHDPAGEKASGNNFQNQGIAYSLDAGDSWVKYPGNPVLKTPGLKDFRDPKVSWFSEGKKWIMTLAAGDRIIFYSSPDLKTWKKESAFGIGIGAHGGVWECPDLLSFKQDGKQIWVLFVSVNPGGVQGGSGTQYFTGSFDGTTFTPLDTVTRWVDYGPDDYAGVTWSNTGDEKIFLGWMSNWLYGTKVPSGNWRSAMTFPRKLELKNIGGIYYLTMMPVNALEKLVVRTESYNHNDTENGITLAGPTRIEFNVPDLHFFSLTFSNAKGQSVKTGYDEEKNAFYIDRSQAGISGFYPGFATIHYAPRIATANESKIVILLDNTSLELFADGGLTTMTEIFFPDQPINSVQQTISRIPLNDIKISSLSSIWNHP